MKSSKSSKSHQKSEKSSKKTDDLPTILAEIYRFLNETPTSKYVIEKTGRDKRLVARDIKRLMKKGYIKRIDRGLYKVIKNTEVVGSSHQNQGKFFRLHNLEIRLRVNASHHKVINSMILKNKQFFNVRGFGHVGNYFDLEVTGLITKEGIFLSYPEGWELTAATKKELFTNLYTLIEETISKWEQRFKLHLFKDGRINFDIRNIHIAYIEDGLVREFKKSNIEYLAIKDDQDGKIRFLIDMSKGFPELEAVHPLKAFSDCDEIEFWGNTIKDGKYREMCNRYDNFFSEGSLSLKHILDLLEEQAIISKDTAHELNILLKTMNIKEPKDTSMVDYFG